MNDGEERCFNQRWNGRMLQVSGFSDKSKCCRLEGAHEYSIPERLIELSGISLSKFSGAIFRYERDLSVVAPLLSLLALSVFRKICVLPVWSFDSISLRRSFSYHDENQKVIAKQIEWFYHLKRSVALWSWCPEFVKLSILKNGSSEYWSQCLEKNVSADEFTFSTINTFGCCSIFSYSFPFSFPFLFSPFYFFSSLSIGLYIKDTMNSIYEITNSLSPNELT